MQTNPPSAPSVFKIEGDDDFTQIDIAPLKPKLASIPDSCRYMGNVSRAYFYGHILPFLDSVYFGARHFVVVQSMDRLIAAKTEPATVGLPSVAVPSTLLSQSASSDDPLVPRAKGNHLPDSANRLNNPRPVDDRREKPRRLVAARGAIEVDDLGRRVNSTISPTRKLAQGSIGADPVGSDRCTALGITTIGRAPVLAVCRLLIEAGYDPATPLGVYRGEILCLRVRTIGEGVHFTGEDDWQGRPRLRHWRDRQERCGAGSSVALSAQRVFRPSARRKSMCGAAP